MIFVALMRISTILLQTIFEWGINASLWQHDGVCVIKSE